MSLLIAILIGVAVGISAAIFISRVRDPDYVMIHVFAGIGGAVLGAAFFTLALQNDNNSDFLSVRGLLCSLVGSLLGVGVLKGIQALPWSRRGREEKL